MATSTVTIGSAPPPLIVSISPGAGAAGRLVTVAGANLTATGTPTTITLAAAAGGPITAPVTSSSATSIIFVIPTGAATGDVSVSAGSPSAMSSTALTINTSSTFALSVQPTAATVIQGQSTTLPLASKA